MEGKVSTYRLGVSLLALFLVFLGLQSLDLMPGVSAQVNVSSRAALAAVPQTSGDASAPSDTQLITGWNTTLHQPGIYQLQGDISGTSGPGITIGADGITLLGDGHSISGDGTLDPFDVDRETGLILGEHSNIAVSGIEFSNLDWGIRGDTSSMTSVSNIDIGNNNFTNNDYYAIQWNNSGTVQDVSVYADSITGNKSGGLYWHSEASGVASNIVFDDNYLFENGTFDFEWSGYGNAQSVIVSDNTFASGNRGFEFYNDGIAHDIFVTGNTFFDYQRPVRIYNEDAADTLNRTAVANNTFASVDYESIFVMNQAWMGQVSVLNNAFTDCASGFVLYNETDADTLNGLDLNNNTFSNTGRGVYVGNYSGMGDVQVVGNFFDACMRPPSYSSSVPLGHINFYGGGEGFLISSNTILNGQDLAGIRFAGSGSSSTPRPFYDVEISFNKIEGLTGSDGTGSAPGMHFFNYSGDTTGSDLGVWDPGEMSAGVGLQIRDNSLITNSGPGISHTVTISASNPTNIDGRMNWWGDPAGPNGPSGDGVSTGVVFSPYSTAAPTKIYLPLILKDD